MSAFGKLLEQLVKASGAESLRAWSLEHGPSVSHVGNVVRGARNPSMEDAARWAKALGLTGELRQRFIRLAAITHLPQEVQADFEGVVRDVDLLKKRLARLERDEPT
jgi:transcriptional regulator with XRE-family HTH domain